MPRARGRLGGAKPARRPLALVSLAPNVLIVRSDSPLNDVGALIAKAKARPGVVNFASGGSGTAQRLAAELFRQKLGLGMAHVPYKSGGPAISDVMEDRSISCPARWRPRSP